MPSDYQNEVTSVICRNIKPSHEKEYDNWLRRFLDLQRKAPGFRGITIIIPGSSKSPMRYVIRRFSDKTSMERWDNSEEAINLLEEVNNYSTRHYERYYYELAIVIFFAAFAISSASRYILNPFIGPWPIFGNAVIYSAILVVSLTYFALPIMNRLLRHWLYPGSV